MSAYTEATKNLNYAKKILYDILPRRKVQYQVPYKERTLNQIISLKDLKVEIKKGSFVVIVGETGSGKSTLLNAMIGELIHLPKSVITDISSDYAKLLTDGELHYLEDRLLKTDLIGASPVCVCGSTSYCEQ